MLGVVYKIQPDNTGNANDNSSIVSGEQKPETPSDDEGKKDPESPSDGDEGKKDPESPSDGDEGKKDPESPSDEDKAKILVVYFSCTNTTKGWAQTLQLRLDADIYEIVPAIPYTADDLRYYTDCRADREQNDPSARPEMNGKVDDISKYDVVYIGYPIWHGQAPKIIYTFLESYDFSGKTIIPFCTSASSPMGSSGSNLHACAPAAVWKDGCRVSSSGNIDTLVSMK